MSTTTARPLPTKNDFLQRRHVVMGVYDDMHHERIRAHDKHAPKGKSCEQMDWTDRDWLPVLTEEVGEVARALCDREPSARLREELVQVGAMAAAWINAIDHAPKTAWRPSGHGEATS